MPPADSRTRSGKQTRVVPAPANGASLMPSAQIDDFSGDPNFMTSLARGLAVIQAFSTRTHQLTISHVSDKTGFSRAAVRRCLYTLAQLGFAGSDDGRNFFLRPRILALGHSYISSMPLAAAAQPVLEHISHLLHESCSMLPHLMARISFMWLAQCDAHYGDRPPRGQPLAGLCTSMGRVLLANLPLESLRPT